MSRRISGDRRRWPSLFFEEVNFDLIHCLQAFPQVLTRIRSKPDSGCQTKNDMVLRFFSIPSFFV